MCTWVSHKFPLKGRGKGRPEWIGLSRANVYYDHPVSVPLEHALVIDFVDESAGPGARISVELSAASAAELARAIAEALASDQARRDLLAAESAASE